MFRLLRFSVTRIDGVQFVYPPPLYPSIENVPYPPRLAIILSFVKSPQLIHPLQVAAVAPPRPTPLAFNESPTPLNPTLFPICPAPPNAGPPVHIAAFLLLAVESAAGAVPSFKCQTPT